MPFRRIRGVKRNVFAENVEWNGAFSAITRYSRKSDFVRGFNTLLNKIFEILDLGLVYYWMMPKNCEKRTIKCRACVKSKEYKACAEVLGRGVGDETFGLAISSTWWTSFLTLLLPLLPSRTRNLLAAIVKEQVSYPSVPTWLRSGTLFVSMCQNVIIDVSFSKDFVFYGLCFHTEILRPTK